MPYGECQSCHSIELSNSLDVTKIDAASHNGVDDARELTRTVNLAPVLGRYRIVILDECHQLTTQSQNALLKCIEEPPSHVVFILCTTELHKVLPTIASRCQRFEFRALSTQVITSQLRLIADAEGIAIADTALKAIAQQARAINLTLPKDVLLYLSEAIGNDTARIASELKKLATFTQGQRLTRQEVQQLVPCQTQTSLQLAEAIRQGDVSQTLHLLHELFARAEVPLVIVATLLTQFRTWLWVKSALSDRTRRNDTEIAQLCGLGHPKRLYYLRQEVAKLSVSTLTQAVTQLLDLEVSLKQGEGTAIVLPKLIAIAYLFVQ